ncbi:Phosphoribulokinase / Uridine kinase family protein [Candida albicans]|uniref:Phosphoribulokinase / Uridine kinase family protein n=1 Tax=Candida albicans TaxID=5476 RepID=A0A8H6F2G5_CANAX|nr:Phosphoribulokinase / Uridine kinase family protein [Candida albicans]
MASNTVNRSIIVLLGGGHASGKKTTALSLKEELSAIVPECHVDVQIIDMNDYTVDGKSSIDSSQFVSNKSAAISINKTHIKAFIDSDSDTRLIRWIRRDVLQNQTDSLEGVINAYLLGARSEMSDFIFPTKEFADVILPRGAEPNAVRLIIDGIMLYLNDKHLTNDTTQFPENILRPNEIGNFQKERFDVQKNKFYELN